MDCVALTFKFPEEVATIPATEADVAASARNPPKEKIIKLNNNVVTIETTFFIFSPLSY